MDKKELEAENARLRARIEELESQEGFVQDQLGQYVLDLRRSNEELEQFAYVASHDLQEPLRTVTNYAGFLLEDHGDKLAPDAKEYVEYIVEAAKRGRTLILDLLELSRVGRDQKKSWVNMNTIVDRVVVGLEFAVRESNALLTRDKLPNVWGDAEMLSRLLHNIISNAVKFSRLKPEPVIQIGALTLENEWHFWVKDNGLGIESKYHDRVFGLFQRLDKAVEGTGIGLAVSRKIVEKHGGTLWVESDPGEGATFHFSVVRPTLDDASSEHTLSRRPSPGCKTASEGVGGGGHTVARTALARWGRSATVLATNGTLRDRATPRTCPPRPQLAEGLWTRGFAGDEE